MIDFIKKYERHLSSGALILGFIIDNLTLQRIDLFYENFVLFSYLIIAGLGIILLNYSDKKKQISFWNKLNHFLPIAIQFAFGGLFSAFFVFYSRSASFLTSFPFLIMLVGLLIGNEFLKKHYSRLVFQISIYFVTIFSFFIFFVPVVIKHMGDWVFLLSGIVSLVFISIFIYLNSLIVKENSVKYKIRIRKNIFVIFIFLNALYFLNIIPPIPLSAKEMGPYGLVKKIDISHYEFKREEITNLWDRILLRKAVAIKPKTNLYFYSAVFAPTKLNTKIYHTWYYFDEDKNRWVDRGTIGFGIVGGRDQGYRGYTIKQIDSEGLWRVDVKNDSNQIIGRERFRVDFR